MKKYIIFLLFTGLFFSTCNENMPVIDCLSCDSEEPIVFPPQTKRVLIEEFTGVRCINCPAGSAEIENLLDFYEGQLIAVSIHAAFFANPYDDASDFRTDEGEFIINFLGLPEAYPSAVIDRKQFTGESDLQLVGQGSWAGRIGSLIDEQAKISIEANNDFDATDRTLTINVKGQAQEIINEPVYLTIMITENGVVAKQLTPDSSPDPDPNYVHKHMLRKVVTAFDGDQIAESMLQEDAFDEVYTVTIPDGWVAENCEVIAFVHLADSSKEVLQATEAHLVE